MMILGVRMKGTVGDALYTCFLDEDSVAHFIAIPRTWLILGMAVGDNEGPLSRKTR